MRVLRDSREASRHCRLFGLGVLCCLHSKARFVNNQMLYTSIYMYMSMYIYICIYIYIYLCMYVCMCVCVCMCMYVYVCKDVSNYVCMYACMYARMYACMFSPCGPILRGCCSRRCRYLNLGFGVAHFACRTACLSSFLGN